MQLVWFFVLGAAMGTLSGLLGIGGGVVVVPGLVLLLGIEIKKATAMSLALIIPVVITGLYKHFSAGTLAIKDLRTVMLVALGGMIFSVVGVYLNNILPAHVIKKIFAIFMIAIGVKMFMSPAKANNKTDNKDGVTVEQAQDSGPATESNAKKATSPEV